MSVLTYYILNYLLIGTIVTFFIEWAVRRSGTDVNWVERILLFTFYPLAFIAFVWNVIKELRK
jgi:hypothetical protein